MDTQKIDYLFTHATVITMNRDKDVLFDGAVAVKDDTIVAVGLSAEMEKTYTADNTIDCGGNVLSPGLVNAHTHVPMNLLRGLSDDLRLDVWLYGFMMPVEREFVTPEFSYLGTQIAAAEMIRSGITSFCDMYYFEDQVAEAAAKAGLRAICGETILKFPTPDAASYDDSLSYCRNFIEKWKGHPLITPAVAPHAPYTATPDMLKACAALALEYDVPIHIHVAETELEQEGSKAEYGMSVVPWLAQYNIFDAKVITAHGVHLEETEMQSLKEAHAGVVHCPSSNLKLASGVAPVHKMLSLDMNVGIGTDGVASNNDLDMIEETRLAAFLQKGFFGDPTLLPAKTAWELATIRGAKAIHLDDITGSLEAGKRADLIIIDMQGTHQTPRFFHNADTIYSQLVYAAKATDVTYVMVNGKMLMEEKQLLTINESELNQKARDFAKKIDAFIASREGDLMSKLLAVGSGVTPVETYEIQTKVKVEDIAQIEAALTESNLTIIRSSTRLQYDTYFCFDQEDLGRIRYREDEILADDGTVKEALYRIGLIGPAAERVFHDSMILTRSRYSLPADKSLRFYREYFNPDTEISVEKTRTRYHIDFKDTRFTLNLDRLKANQDSYLEVQSRTWSAKDAEDKAALISELLTTLGLSSQDGIGYKEYTDLI